jgi:hypothetical protein
MVRLAPKKLNSRESFVQTAKLLRGNRQEKGCETSKP